MILFLLQDGFVSEYKNISKHHETFLNFQDIDKPDTLTDLDMPAIDEPARFIPELQETTSHSLDRAVRSSPKCISSKANSEEPEKHYLVQLL